LILRPASAKAQFMCPVIVHTLPILTYTIPMDMCSTLFISFVEITTLSAHLQWKTISCSAA